MIPMHTDSPTHPTIDLTEQRVPIKLSILVW
jgi:hypothetical protein